MPVKRILQPDTESGPPIGNMVGWAPGFPGPDVWKIMSNDDVTSNAERLDIIADMIIEHGEMLVKHGQAMKRLAQVNRGEDTPSTAQDVPVSDE